MSFVVSEKFPSIAPSAIAVGTVYTHATSFIISRPIFGALYQKARGNNAENVAKSEEAATAAATYGSSLVSSSAQAYAVAALLKLTGVASYKAASILGTLLFAITTGPQLVNGFLIEKKSVDVLASQGIVSLLDTVGLSLALTWWSKGNPVLRQ